MRTLEICHTRTLDYYDGVQLFEARDPIGRNYVAALVDVGGVFDRYLVVSCEPEELRKLRTGVTDLRSLMERYARHGWYFADVANISEPFSVIPQEGSVIPDEFLPGSGLFLEEALLDDDLTSPCWSLTTTVCVCSQSAKT